MLFSLGKLYLEITDFWTYWIIDYGYPVLNLFTTYWTWIFTNGINASNIIKQYSKIRWWKSCSISTEKNSEDFLKVVNDQEPLIQYTTECEKIRKYLIFWI